MSNFLLIDKYGSYLGVKNGLFVVKIKEKDKWVKLAEVSPAQIDSIVIAVDGVSITSAAMMLAGSRGIDVTFLSGYMPVCRVVPATYGSSIRIWAKQLRQSSSKERRKELAASFVSAKIHNQIMVLRTFYKVDTASGRKLESVREAISGMEELKKNLASAEDWRKVGVIEANAAYLYWRSVKEFLPKELGFEKRLKRWSLPHGESSDAFNIALNIGYSILSKEVWRAVFIANLNPYIGFLHARRPGRLSLVYDLMEEFRPIAVDRPLIKLARKDPQTIKHLKSQDEEARRKATRIVWKTVLELIREAKPPLREIITTQARRLAYAILNNTAYNPYKARW